MRRHDHRAAKAILLLLVVVDYSAGLPLFENRINSQKTNFNNLNLNLKESSSSLFEPGSSVFTPHYNSAAKHPMFTGRMFIVGEETKGKRKKRTHINELPILADSNVFYNESVEDNFRRLPFSENNLSASTRDSNPQSSYEDSLNVREVPRLKSKRPSIFDNENLEPSLDKMEQNNPTSKNSNNSVKEYFSLRERRSFAPTFIYSNFHLSRLRNTTAQLYSVDDHRSKSRRQVDLNSIPSTLFSKTTAFVAQHMPHSWPKSESSFFGALNYSRPSLFDAVLYEEKKSVENVDHTTISQESSRTGVSPSKTILRLKAKPFVHVKNRNRDQPCERGTDKLFYNFQESGAPASAVARFSPEDSKSGSLFEETIRTSHDHAEYNSQNIDTIKDRNYLNRSRNLKLGSKNNDCEPTDDLRNDTLARVSLFDKVLAEIMTSTSGVAGTSGNNSSISMTEPTQHIQPPQEIQQSQQIHHVMNSQQTQHHQLIQHAQQAQLDSEVSPGLLQGDIAVDLPSDETLLRVGLNWDVFPERRWINGIVPYVVSPLYSPEEVHMITTAIRTINFLTCVRFVPWDGRAPDYVIIRPVPEPHGCWSYVGRRGGPQEVGLQRADGRSKRCFASVGKPLHELLHVLGVLHEHTRPDRDMYIRVMLHNMLPDARKNFEKLNAVNASYAYDYDYDSVMHYGPNYFSKDGISPTIRPLMAGVRIGQRDMLSKRDCLKLNAMYNCTARGHPQREMYTVFCNALTL